MNSRLKNELLETGFNKKLNYILKKCIEINSSLTGLGKKLKDIEEEYCIKLFKTDLFDSVKESNKWQLGCIKTAANEIVEISEELISVSVIGGALDYIEDLSDVELKQRFNDIKEIIIEYSSTTLSICNPEGVFIELDSCDHTAARIYLLLAGLFKIAAEMKKKGYDSIDHIVSLFFEISIRGNSKNS